MLGYLVSLIAEDALQLDQCFFCNPIILGSICYHTREKRLINEGNATGGLNFFEWDCVIKNLLG